MVIILKKMKIFPIYDNYNEGDKSSLNQISNNNYRGNDDLKIIRMNQRRLRNIKV